MTRTSIHAAGRERDTLMPADALMPCKRPEVRDIFDQVIGTDEHKRTGRRYRVAVQAAKRVCREECPVRAACFAVHGHDLELGVVAGLTDTERGNRLKARP